MKKRMLITTIVMVLVVAIALTTSSLAWFTMSATVEISEVSFGAVAYTGSQLSVAGLDRNGFGASASIGSPVLFDPSQGNPLATTLTSGTAEGIGGFTGITIAADTFHQAAVNGVETTGAGNETSNQKVKLTSSSSAVFIGGFNVRNDGTADASVKIDATLKVGTAHRINPNGSAEVDGDEYYVYGTLISSVPATLVVDATGCGEYKWATGQQPTPAAVQEAFAATSADKALAGGLRVAVYNSTWIYTIQGGTFSDGETAAALNLEAIYNFTQYKVTWGASGWTVAETTGDKNDLYVTEPVADTVYSMNYNLAAPTGYVSTDVNTDDTTPNAGVASTYALQDVGAGNALPQKTYTINGTNDAAAGTLEGLQIVVVVWMDGWDAESVPAAGGGKVSLAYKVAG